jgi:hypothetical protein
MMPGNSSIPPLEQPAPAGHVSQSVRIACLDAGLRSDASAREPVMKPS